MTGFAVGDFHCTYLRAGAFEIDAGTVFAGTSALELGEALARHRLDPGSLTFLVRALLVETDSNRVFIDPAGTWEDKYRLAEVIEQKQIDPASIDVVVISHGHGDHFWGGVDAEGRPLFPSARYFIQRQEWEHWLSDDNPEPDHVANFRQTLLPLEDRFELVEDAEELVPGIRALPTPGHSPGHMAIEIGAQAIYTGDVLLSPLSVEQPRWPAAFDIWPEQVVETRLQLLGKVAAQGSLVFTCHFPGSGVGRVVAEGEGWRWLPEDLG